MSLVPCLLVAALTGPASTDDWPDWRGPNRDGAWHEDGVVDELPAELPILWRRPIGSGYTGPTVADGCVYVMDRVEDPEPGERVLCFDAASGEPLWEHAWKRRYDGLSYAAGPRCAVVVADGRAFALGAMGDLACLDAKSGALAWSRDLDAKYSVRLPIWGLSATPLLESGRLIVPVSGVDACLVAFDPATGEEEWRALDDGGNYSAPIAIDQAGRRVVVCWTATRIVGIDPATGDLLWEHAFAPKQMPLGVATPVFARDALESDGEPIDVLFVTGFYDGSLALRVAREELAVEELWRRRGPNERRTDGLQSIISTPLIRGGHVYGVDSYGELRCLELDDGARVWEDDSAVPRARWATIHFVQNGERTWMFNERGELIVAELSPAGFRELSRAKLIEPTRGQLNQRDGVCWSHPAFAGRRVFARNDRELVCADLAGER